MSTTEIGNTGESLALSHLQQQEFKLLDRNFRWKKAEIDLIGMQGKQLVFVEVKMRATAQMGEPFQAVTRSKQRMLIFAANAYIQQKNLDADARFDVVSIIANQFGTQIEHIRDAFYPTV